MKIEEWAKDFKEYINELQLSRDDYKGIMLYIDDALTIVKELKQVLSVADSVEKKVGK